jgi:hypothetical protein
LVKLKSPQKAHRLKKVYGTVFALLSFKLNCVVGQKFTKLIQVAHTAFFGNYSYLFFRLLEKYPNAEFDRQDIQSGGKLAKKITVFLEKNVPPDHSYDDVFRELFPELFAQ